MSKFSETMEHASHNTHETSDARLRIQVGVTIAVLGVLLALSSALVGGQRTELIAKMVEQTNTSMKYQSLSTRHRVLLAQLRQLHALTPNEKLFDEWEAESRKLRGEISSPDIGRLARIIRLENAKNLDAEFPSHDDLVSFAGVIRAVDKEQTAAHEWTESFDGAIAAHTHGAEHFEWAELSTELGIVMASLSLLLSRRSAWYLAMMFGLITVVMIGATQITVSSQLHKADETIEHAKAHFESIGGEKRARTEDEDLLTMVEKTAPPVVDPK